MAEMVISSATCFAHHIVVFVSAQSSRIVFIVHVWRLVNTLLYELYEFIDYLPLQRLLIFNPINM